MSPSSEKKRREKSCTGYKVFNLSEMVIKNVRLKLWIIFSFQQKCSHNSGARMQFFVLFFYFSVFISKWHGLPWTYEDFAPLPANIPTLTTPVVPQLPDA